MRWLIPFIFLPGILGKFFNLPGASYSLSMLSLVSMLFCFLLVSQLARPIKKTLWAWIILFVFIMGNYIEYFFLLDFLISGRISIFSFEMSWLNQEILTKGLLWASIGFWMYCITASILLSLQKKKSTHIDLFPQLKLSFITPVFLSGFYMLAVIVSFLPIYFGFGQMGVEHHRLPFRLDAFITHFNMTLVPIVSLLLLWLTDNTRQRKYWWFIIVIFISLIALNSIIRASRAALLLASIPLLFLWLLTDKLTLKRKIFIVITVIAIFIFHPFFSTLRTLRMAGSPLGIIDLGYALHSISDFYQIGSIVIQATVARVGGMDGLLHNIYHGTPTFIDLNRLIWLLDNETIVNYQTFEVVGIPYGVIEGRSPGLLGVFAMVGGISGIIILVPLYTVLVWYFWNITLNLKIYPVAIAFLAGALLFYTSEGTLGLQAPIAWVVGIIIVSVIYKATKSRAKIKTAGYNSSTHFLKDGI